MTDVITWMIFQAAVCYGRKGWSNKRLVFTIEERGAYDYHWDNIWRMQRELGCPPVGVIRSCS